MVTIQTSPHESSQYIEISMDHKTSEDIEDSLLSDTNNKSQSTNEHEDKKFSHSEDKFDSSPPDVSQDVEIQINNEALEIVGDYLSVDDNRNLEPREINDKNNNCSRTKNNNSMNKNNLCEKRENESLSRKATEDTRIPIDDVHEASKENDQLINDKSDVKVQAIKEENEYPTTGANEVNDGILSSAQNKDETSPKEVSQDIELVMDNEATKTLDGAIFNYSEIILKTNEEKTKRPDSPTTSKFEMQATKEEEKRPSDNTVSVNIKNHSSDERQVETSLNETSQDIELVMNNDNGDLKDTDGSMLIVSSIDLMSRVNEEVCKCHNDIINVNNGKVETTPQIMSQDIEITMGHCTLKTIVDCRVNGSQNHLTLKASNEQNNYSEQQSALPTPETSDGLLTINKNDHELQVSEEESNFPGGSTTLISENKNKVETLSQDVSQNIEVSIGNGVIHSSGEGEPNELTHKEDLEWKTSEEENKYLGNSTIASHVNQNRVETLPYEASQNIYVSMDSYGGGGLDQISVTGVKTPDSLNIGGVMYKEESVNISPSSSNSPSPCEDVIIGVAVQGTSFVSPSDHYGVIIQPEHLESMKKMALSAIEGNHDHETTEQCRAMITNVTNIENFMLSSTPQDDEPKLSKAPYEDRTLLQNSVENRESRSFMKNDIQEKPENDKRISQEGSCETEINEPKKYGEHESEAEDIEGRKENIHVSEELNKREFISTEENMTKVSKDNYCNGHQLGVSLNVCGKITLKNDRNYGHGLSQKKTESCLKQLSNQTSIIGETLKKGVLSMSEIPEQFNDDLNKLRQKLMLAHEKTTTSLELKKKSQLEQLSNQSSIVAEKLRRGARSISEIPQQVSTSNYCLDLNKLMGLKTEEEARMLRRAAFNNPAADDHVIYMY